MDHTRELYVQLSLIDGIGPVSQNRMLQICGGIDACFEMDVNDIMELDRKEPCEFRIGKARLQKFAEQKKSVEVRSASEQILSLCDKKDIDIICSCDVAYPERFTGIPQIPVLLYVRGDLRLNQYTNSVGIIGARRCIQDTKNVAVRVAEEKSNSGYALISGLAKGIDSYAHTATIKTGGYTIAVLGNGPDLCYPKEHQALYDVIVDNGCILSEYPPGTTPRKYSFPARNRLIAALSDEVYVIGAGRNSGTKWTVEYCRKYGRRIKKL